MKLNKAIIGLSLLFAGNNVVSCDPVTFSILGSLAIGALSGYDKWLKENNKPTIFLNHGPEIVEQAVRASAIGGIVYSNPICAAAAVKTFGENAGQDAYDLVGGLGMTTARATAQTIGQLAGRDLYEQTSGKAAENKAEREKGWQYEDKKAERENVSIDQRDDDIALRKQEIEQRASIQSEQVVKHSEHVVKHNELRQMHMERMQFPERFGNGAQGSNGHFFNNMSSSFNNEHKE
jgi:hypothetical protein